MNNEVLAFEPGALTATCTPNTNSDSISELEYLFIQALSTSNYNLSSFDSNLTALSTHLISFNGCDAFEKEQILSGWQQSWKLMNFIVNLESSGGINFNEAAALEYLAPPAYNTAQQAAIRSKFTIPATCFQGHFAEKYVELTNSRSYLQEHGHHPAGVVKCLEFLVLGAPCSVR
jgi:hypothetical protein